MTRSNDIERLLFDAARNEQPASDLRRRTYDAMKAAGEARAAPRLPRPLLASVTLGGAAAMAAGAALMMSGSGRDPLVLEREPISVRASVSAGEAPTVEPPPAPSLTPPSGPQARTQPGQMLRRPPTLRRETAALDGVRKRLEAGDSAGALLLLKRYRDRNAINKLSAEAALLEIEALARSGRRAEAEALSSQFVAANPGSPLADRARALVEERGDSPPSKGDP